MRQLTICIISALLFMVLLTTCAIADPSNEGVAGAGTFYIDVVIPPTSAAIDTMLRDWVDNLYVPMLVQNGALSETMRGDVRLGFSFTFEGEQFIGVAMRGTLGDTVLTESLNINKETGTFVAPWEILDYAQAGPILSKLRDQITERSPQAEPYLYDMSPSWLTGVYLTDGGLAVPINTGRFLPGFEGDFRFVLPYEALGAAFLLAGTPDFPPTPIEAPYLPIPEPTPRQNEIFTDTHAHSTNHDSILDYLPEPEPADVPRRPMIALTFDDGPSVFTGMILDILEQHNARATFCVLGNRVKNWENTILRAVAGGNEIIGHSWNHTNMTNQSRANAIDAIRNTDDAIYAVTGTRTPLFRPPFGDINSQLESVAAELGYGILMWSIDPQDWRENHQSPDFIYQWIMNQARDGSIVVLHDIYLSTVQAMEKLIPRLIADGFELVTASELIIEHYGDIEPGKRYNGIRIR
ncbi:MAG: polysaccharide deacetylase family protein [Defluviitaleaceae bacterium]|nr:polysaccharide deacetylase family protein [Defluviitaleaceae bacterium]